MKLFHGTSTKYLDAILRDGIQPRNVTGIDTSARFSTGTDFLSAPNHVYLSSDSARYAICTPMADNDPDDFVSKLQSPLRYAPVLIEVDMENLCESRLRPDEDWLSNILLLAEADASGQEVDHSTDEFYESLRSLQGQVCADMSAFGSVWDLSLRHYGCVAHEGAIPPTAFRRISTLPLTNRQFCELALVVETDHFQLGSVAQQQMQSAVLKWMMGQPTSIDDWLTNAWRFPKELRRMIMNWTRLRPTFLNPNYA